jgi:hypothetical protein
MLGGPEESLRVIKQAQMAAIIATQTGDLPEDVYAAIGRHPSSQQPKEESEGAKILPFKPRSSKVEDVTDLSSSTEDLNTPDWTNRLKNADLYAKSAVIRAHQATEETPITTKLQDGHIETTNVAQPGDWIVTNPGGEQYTMPHEKFQSRYQPHPNIEGAYVPTGAPTPAVQINRDMSVMAPWGEAQHMRSGDWIVGSPEGTDRYGIADKEFKDTYALHTVQYNVASVREARVMSNEFAERTASSSTGIWDEEDDDMARTSGLLNDWAQILPGPFKSDEEKALESANEQAANLAAGGTYVPIAQRPGYTPPTTQESPDAYSKIHGQGTSTPSAVDRNAEINSWTQGGTGSTRPSASGAKPAGGTVVNNITRAFSSVHTAAELPEWIKEAMKQSGLYPDDPEAEAYDMQEQQGRDAEAETNNSETPLADPICGLDPELCDSSADEHCTECGACPDVQHSSGCSGRDDFDDPMDGDPESALASAGHGMDEDYDHGYDMGYE